MAKNKVCHCLCHEQSELSVKGEGIATHRDKCVCNGGTGYTDFDHATDSPPEPEQVFDPQVQEHCRHLLWHFGRRDVGWEPGGFMEKLLSAWDTADNENYARLAMAFPDLHIAISISQGHGHEGLLAYAEGRTYVHPEGETSWV